MKKREELFKELDKKHYDEYLKASYRIVRANAKKVKEYLLDSLSKSGINPKDFNKQGYNDGVENPPIEIYEYQPFFLMERNNGEFTLLDGFRRLLWYNSPDHDITIRIYNERELTNQQIMKLMIYLNHFKFYGGGDYHDRGFALAMKTLFGLNIPKYTVVFDSYLSSNETQRKYWSERKTDDGHIESVKERMLNPMFISDMTFIESLCGTGVMFNDIFGALVYKMRLEFPDKEFHSSEFLKRVNSNEIIVALHEKYKKSPKDLGVETQKIINQIVPLYENIFKDMFGGEIVKTYAEYKDEAKKLVEELKKDKTLTKLTGNQKAYVIDWILRKRIKENIPIIFKCVVYPRQIDPYSWNKEPIPLKTGILESEIKLVNIQKKSLGGTELVFGFEENGHKFIFHHNWGSGNRWSSSGKRYTKVETVDAVPCTSYDVDLFVNVTKEEIDYQDKHRNNI